jgi:hypothetical protein
MLCKMNKPRKYPVVTSAMIGMIITPERLTAISRLALIRAKVERADKNLTDMETVLFQCHGGVPGRERYIKALKSKEGETIIFTIPFDCLAAAGDVVNNLRGALDHLAYQMADAYTPNCPTDVLERTGGNPGTVTLFRKQLW